MNDWKLLETGLNFLTCDHWTISTTRDLNVRFKNPGKFCLCSIEYRSPERIITISLEWISFFVQGNLNVFIIFFQLKNSEWAYALYHQLTQYGQHLMHHPPCQICSPTLFFYSHRISLPFWSLQCETPQVLCVLAVLQCSPITSAANSIYTFIPAISTSLNSGYMPSPALFQQPPHLCFWLLPQSTGNTV